MKRALEGEKKGDSLKSEQKNIFKHFDSQTTYEDNVEVLCDLMELRCLFSKGESISITKMVSLLLKATDEEPTSGIDDLQDKVRDKVEMVMIESQRRKSDSRYKYPFDFKTSGVMVFLGFKNPYSYLYVYLLLVTRLNMNTNKLYAGIDGTFLFEKLSAIIARSYFGENSSAIVIGTSEGGGFQSKINALSVKLNEGFTFYNHSGGSVDENDGKLDFIVWIDFTDKKPSKLIAFAQCKTGTNWRKHISELNAESFCRNWFTRMPALMPIRLFFISDIPQGGHWYKTATHSGLFFDRIRIMDYSPKDLEKSILLDIEKWTKAALKQSKLLF